MPRRAASSIRSAATRVLYTRCVQPLLLVLAAVSSRDALSPLLFFLFFPIPLHFLSPFFLLLGSWLAPPPSGSARLLRPTSRARPPVPLRPVLPRGAVAIVFPYTASRNPRPPSSSSSARRRAPPPSPPPRSATSSAATTSSSPSSRPRASSTPWSPSSPSSPRLPPTPGSSSSAASSPPTATPAYQPPPAVPSSTPPSPHPAPPAPSTRSSTPSSPAHAPPRPPLHLPGGRHSPERVLLQHPYACRGCVWLH